MTIEITSRITTGISLALCIAWNFISAGNNLTFTENRGQISNQHYQPRPDVLFSGETKGLVFHLRKNGISYQQSRIETWIASPGHGLSGTIDGKIPSKTTIYRTDITWLNSTSNPVVEKMGLVEGYTNFYLSSCHEGILGVESYREVTYKNIYQGIDFRCYNKNNLLEYDYLVSGGVDYKQIRWKIEGADAIYVSENGELVIRTPLGEIREVAPIAFQGRRSVKIDWNVSDNVVGFKIDSYDPSLPLLIDPIVRLWSTYYGGGDQDIATFTVTDGTSAVLMAGVTYSTSSIATSGAHQTSYGGTSGGGDAFLVKFNSSGVRQWATYYGGAYSESGQACAVDGSSNVYLAGFAGSSSGIATSGSHQDTYSAGYDAFLVKFNSSGVRQWATYYGGTGNDFGNHCATDASSNVYLVGETTSTGGIATSGAHQTSLGSSTASDGYIAKFNSSGVRQWGTYYGGSGIDFGMKVAIEGSSNVYLAGGTESSTNVATSSSHQSFYNGSRDGLLVKFNSNGVRQWATYYGGFDAEYCRGLAIDGSSNVYISGGTLSTSYIASSSSHQSSLNNDYDGFLAKFNSSGTRQWGTYYGGSDFDFVVNCTTDNSSNVYIAGETHSSGDIATNDGFQSSFGGNRDGFVVKFNSSGVRQWGTYYGGTAEELSWACSVDANKNVYLVGLTNSSTGVATSGSHQSTFGGGTFDAYLVKFSECAPTTTNISPVACLSYKSPSGKHIWTASGTYTDTVPSAQGCDSVLQINLTVNKVDVSVTATGGKITSNALSATYKWYDCVGMGLINGANQQEFKPAVNGNYAVIVTQNGCSDTSDCIQITAAGFDPNGTADHFRLYPNPTKGKVVVQMMASFEKVNVTVTNSIGQVVKEFIFEKQSQFELDLGALRSGLYNLNIRAGKLNYTTGIVKE